MIYFSGIYGCKMARMGLFTLPCKIVHNFFFHMSFPIFAQVKIAMHLCPKQPLFAIIEIYANFVQITAQSTGNPDYENNNLYESNLRLWHR